MEAPADRGQVAPEIETSPTYGDMESDPALSGEREREVVQPWQEQLTVRGLVAALLIGFVYTVIVMKLALTTGLVPTLNVSTALVSFILVRGWTYALQRLGIASRLFTRQENTVIQACADSCFSIASSG